MLTNGANEISLELQTYRQPYVEMRTGDYSYHATQLFVVLARDRVGVY